jgi:type VI protein secretion system component VasF
VPVAEAKVPTWVVALIAVAIVIVIVIGVSGCIATFDP